MQEKKRTRDFAATRARILETARTLFAEAGYQATGTNDVVKAAGITRGALYHHFADKQALFAAVLRDVQIDIDAEILEAAGAATDPVEGLVAGSAAFLDACARSDRRQILLLDGPSVLGWAAWREIDMEHGLGSLKEGLQIAADAGAIRSDLPLDTLAHMLSGALNEAIFLMAEAEDPAAQRSEVISMVEAFIHSLGSK